MSLSELVRLCPPPSNPTSHYSPEKEREVIADLSLSFPMDYVEYCKTYGRGKFVSPVTHEIFIANIFEPNSTSARSLIQDAIDDCFSNPEMKEPLDRLGVEVDSLFPLASDTETTCLAWVTDQELDKWRVLSFEYEEQNVELFDISVTDFLAGYFSGKLYVRGWAHRLKGGQVQKYSFIPATARR